MLEAPKSIAFIEPSASDRFTVTIRSFPGLKQISSRLLQHRSRLHDLHATIAELAGLVGEVPGLGYLILLTDAPLTSKTVEPELFSHCRLPAYCVNRSSAFAWASSANLCRFVLIDFREPGSIVLVKRNEDGDIEDVRLFETSVASMTDSDLATILRVAAGFGYSSVVASNSFDEEALHRGAVRAIAARTRSSGVWVDPFSDTEAFAMRTMRRISYSVVQLDRPVYDCDESALASFIGRRPVLFAVDANVDAIYGNRIRRYADEHVDVAAYVTVESGEETKSLEQVERLVRASIEAHLPRHGIIVGVGGGVVLDIAGMAAALYRRGISYIRVATTFLAMIDVAVGIKHGVNFAGRKNIIGTFYPPMAAINDPLFLRTNSRRQLGCGVAEAIKIALVADRRLFDLLEEHLSSLVETHFAAPPTYAREILNRAQIAMMNELAPNLFESDLKRAADFGHSFSPQIEAESNHALVHGEAVAIDMLLCVALGVRRGLCPASLFERLVRMYAIAGLPMNDARCTVAFLRRALTDVTAHRGGNLNLLIPKEPGSYEYLQEVSDLDLQFAVDAVCARAVTAAEAG